ncbi:MULTISPECIES: Uma2 family endonuclease [Actinoplanes]|uniref:Uma2 family endonuclease n=1 Tax=Actinoplanes TaxID=1865 RepID=UPI000ACB339D|nr:MULTISPECIES: Uma2 family endonuclease [Actinoplanes]GLY04255.1 hypothetical protein Acsp01_46340 [Actinoplanes sp. NBRC 101535]
MSLGATTDRIELIDGSLVVSPAPNSPHQEISYLLTAALRPTARAHGFRAQQAVNLRLAPHRILIPDVTVSTAPRLSTYVEAADAVLVAEVTSPGNAAVDRTTKLTMYAAAGIPWYLLAEPDMTDYRSLTLHLLHLQGDTYVPRTTATDDELLRAETPFPMALTPTTLLDF